jgi:hypothetical protein
MDSVSAVACLVKRICPVASSQSTTTSRASVNHPSQRSSACTHAQLRQAQVISPWRRPERCLGLPRKVLDGCCPHILQASALLGGAPPGSFQHYGRIGKQRLSKRRVRQRPPNGEADPPT